MGVVVINDAPPVLIHRRGPPVVEGVVPFAIFEASRRITGTAMADEKTLFQKIADHEVPADIVYEDDRCVAFRDIDPKAPTHLLVVPRKPIPSLAELTEEDGPLVGHLFVVARQLAEEEGLDGGYRTVFNCGDDAGMAVPHLHLHLLGGRKLTWPPG